MSLEDLVAESGTGQTDVPFEDLTDAVRDAIEATADGHGFEDALRRLTALPAPVIMEDLFLWVEDVTDDTVDIDAFLRTVRLPLPPEPRALVVAALERDMDMLDEALGNPESFEEVVIPLLFLIAALKNARGQ